MVTCEERKGGGGGGMAGASTPVRAHARRRRCSVGEAGGPVRGA
jgi:hypothetical protein